MLSYLRLSGYNYSPTCYPVEWSALYKRDSGKWHNKVGLVLMKEQSPTKYGPRAGGDTFDPGVTRGVRGRGLSAQWRPRGTEIRTLKDKWSARASLTIVRPAGWSLSCGVGRRQWSVAVNAGQWVVVIARPYQWSDLFADRPWRICDWHLEGV